MFVWRDDRVQQTLARDSVYANILRTYPPTYATDFADNNQFTNLNLSKVLTEQPIVFILSEDEVSNICVWDICIQVSEVVQPYMCVKNDLGRLH